jgi:hypothetical protein
MKASKLTLSLLIFGIALLSGTFSAKAQEDVYSLHAMFIHNFIKYTEWPNGGQQIVVGVINNASATQTLNQKISSSAGKVQVKNLKNADEAGNCQVVFVPSTSRGHLARVLELVKGKNILVITEDQDMIRKGAGISFKVVNDKMKFQINQDAIKSSGLKVSGSLLALAVN